MCISSVGKRKPFYLYSVSIRSHVTEILMTFHFFLAYADESFNYFILYKKILSNMQSEIDSSRELNSELLAEVT